MFHITRVFVLSQKKQIFGPKHAKIAWCSLFLYAVARFQTSGPGGNEMGPSKTQAMIFQ